MDVDRLAVFRCVAREGGFSRAARRLGRTQPAISQAVRSLEEELGEPLFLRLGRRIELTQAGAVYLEHVEAAEEALARGRDRLAELRGLEAGTLRVGASDTTACHILPPILAEYRRRHPGITLRISNRPSPRTRAQAAERRVDLGFVTLSAQDEVDAAGLVVEPLMEREDVAIFAPGHPLAGRRRIRLAELLAHPLLLLDRGSQTRAFIDAQIVLERSRMRGVEVRIAMELASIEVVKRLVALDFGVSVAPAIAVADEVASGALCAARIQGRGQRRRLGVVYDGRAALSRPARAFLELARERLCAP